MKRLLAILCTLALVLSVANPAVFAAENSSMQAAMDDDSSEIIVLEEDTSNLTINRDTTIDLNGHNIDGVTVTGGTLYCLDSQTADYTVADGVYGHVTNVTGAVKAAEGYLQVGNSFHAVNLDIYAMTLRAADVGVYYKSNFAADEIVAAQVESFGVALSVVTAPNAENLNSYCGYSQFTGFEAGEGANSVGTSTLLKGIMKPANGDNRNAKNAAMPVYGRAYIKTSEGYFFGETVKRSLQEQVEAIDGIWAGLKDTQKAPVLSMLEGFTSVMEGWSIPNILGGEAGEGAGEIEIDVAVNAENGVVTEATTVEQGAISITVPAGVKLAEGANKLTLTVTPVEAEDTGLTLKEDRVLIPMDVHVEGVAADNAQPITIYLGKIMPENLNMGNYTVYHVENGNANEMTLIGVNEEFTAHNQYKYSLDGELTLYMASFSVVAAEVDEEAKWEGGFDYSWYDASETEFEIRNADQLAAFGAIVGDMAFKEVEVQEYGYTLIDTERIVEADSFAGKTVVLLADIDLGDKDDASKHIFYPIGYGNTSMSYVKPNDGTTVGTYMGAFEGTFDGNGNTIANFYQNTWQMWGNYDGNNYKAAMGLFGYVLNGTVKNLTVDHFSSDGEFTPTGVIAAYAENSTFENIAITYCNPRVYNTGNGGIIGIGGRTGDTSGQQLTLKNITVDNSNKITALWGSWDVACGGLVGMFRGNADGGNGQIHFENCHVAAQIDVYNDVCANYQYYAYRYSGMLIGSVRHNVKDDNGHVYPNMDGITASDCTVHFGDWNDYYYCELVANTTASYTHDHQFSRLVQVEKIDATAMKYLPLGAEDLDSNWVAIPTSGRVNYVVVNGEHATENASCFHFVDGAEWNHEQGGYEEKDINGDGKIDSDVLKEDKQHIYREFNNLVTGYGWGVTSKAIGDMEGVTILDRLEGNSVKKFENSADLRENRIYPTGTPIKLASLVQATAAGEDKLTAIRTNTLQVTVSPADETSTVKATYSADKDNWLNGTLLFDLDGEGAAKITITDYYFCEPFELTIQLSRYTADLYWVDEAAKTAYCPYCKANKNWTAVNTVTDGTTRLVAVTSSSTTTKLHYYLSEDITYSGTETFVSTSSTSARVCFHLNGQNVEITTDKAFAWSSGGYINILGDGQVTKTTGTSIGLFYTNTNSLVTEHNIYGGTYLSQKGSVIRIAGNGGVFNVYKGVVLEATSGTAVYVGTAGLRSAILTIKGAEVKGDIDITSPKRTTNEDPNNPGYTATTKPNKIQDSCGNTYVTLTDTKITGTVTVNNTITDANKTLDFTVSGSTVISKLVLKNQAQVIMDNLTTGAKIGVSATADTPFTVVNENAAAYRKYFYAVADAQIVRAENNQLVCVAPTYTDDLEFKADGKAWCVACGEKVAWTAIAAGEHEAALARFAKGSHHYLAGDVTYDGEGNFVSAPEAIKSADPAKIGDPGCLHLNGHNITTKNTVINAFTGQLNVLGTGVLTSKAANTVYANVIGFSSVNLYSGTYTQVAGNSNPVIYVAGNGGHINVYENAEITAVDAYAILMGSTSTSAGYRCNELLLDGAVVNGNITVNSPNAYASGQYADATKYPYFAYAGTAEIVLTDAIINGTMTLDDRITAEDKYFHFTINGTTTIRELVLKNNAKVIIGELENGAEVTFGTLSANAAYVTVVEGVETTVNIAEYSGKTIRYVDGNLEVVDP